jgi:hypothetical protein
MGFKSQMGAEQQPTRLLLCSSIVGGNRFDYFPCAAGTPCGCNLAAIPCSTNWACDWQNILAKCTGQAPG